jgi:hypothetical protein
MSRACLEALEHRQLLSFTLAASYETGSNPWAVATADFNNDTHLDLATANSEGSVSVRLGNGHGGFGDQARYSVGSWARSVSVGDFNEDGKLDLATANQTNYDLSVLPGNGDGTFGDAKSVPAYGSPTSVAVGDFNADGHLDLGVASWGYGLFYYGFASIHAGDGNGNFAPPKVTSTWFRPFERAVAANVNGDGADDLVVADDWDTLNVFLGDPSGYFREPIDLAIGNKAQDLAVGDVNRDGFADIVTANNFDDYAVSVLLGNGAGGFGSPQNYVPGDWSESVALGDFTGDGEIDIAYESDGVSVLHGNGDGTFSATVQPPAGQWPNDMAVGDFNEDGWIDVAAAHFSDTVSVLINDQSWQVSPPTPPLVSVNDVTVTEGNTAAVNAVFTVTLSKAASSDVTVHYVTANITAIAGSDYTAKSGTLTIPAGQTSRTFSVAVLGDRLAESNETFEVNLSAPTNAMIGDSQGIGSILDNEPRISINNVSLNEGKAKTKTFTFMISLSAAYDQPVTVNYATANGSATAGSDYQAKTGSVTFAPGETAKKITISVMGDKQKEANETFFVDLFGASSNSLISIPRGIGTILNDDNR